MPSLSREALRYQDPLGRKLLALLDATRKCDELLAAMGGPFAGPAGRAQLDNVLKILASKALLDQRPRHLAADHRSAVSVSLAMGPGLRHLEENRSLRAIVSPCPPHH